MARIGGRNLWIAVPATVVGFAVVLALLWLAVPMVPVVIDWIGNTLREATLRSQQAQQDEIGGTLDRTSLDTFDCRDLYPNGLWTEISWAPGASLTQDASPPATSVPGLAEVLAPQVVVTCVWTRDADGSITTTLAEVGPDAGMLADAALRGQGFSCDDVGGALTCRRDEGRIREEHTVTDGFWLASIEERWRPDDYGSRVATWLLG